MTAGKFRVATGVLRPGISLASPAEKGNVSLATATRYKDSSQRQSRSGLQSGCSRCETRRQYAASPDC
ncbi:hypothetical protein PANT111_250055 [Pantoea brenneri]|uniref:Transposase n=1 Tax=Pantoea brenneri TaxID=472694 RepID=A0AAX3J8Z2_9GAMM|nr:hypothetical protein PANT111_250055 [Pantoea brenneri]